jgi:hypothetical protein
VLWYLTWLPAQESGALPDWCCLVQGRRGAQCGGFRGRAAVRVVLLTRVRTACSSQLSFRRVTKITRVRTACSMCAPNFYLHIAMPRVRTACKDSCKNSFLRTRESCLSASTLASCFFVKPVAVLTFLAGDLQWLVLGHMLGCGKWHTWFKIIFGH